MRLYYETVPKPLLECLQKLMTHRAFSDFVLVGGTALSLQLGHRRSVDIDLFTTNDYGSMNLEEIKCTLATIFPYTARLETLTRRNLGYSVYIGNSQAETVKLDLFYTEEFIAPIIQQDGLRLASLQDIAAMKLQTIVNNRRKKDFWDIHELLEHFTLKELIQYAQQRSPYTLTPTDILDTLCNLTVFTELNDDTFILCFKGKYWELIVEDLRTIAEQCRNNEEI